MPLTRNRKRLLSLAAWTLLGIIVGCQAPNEYKPPPPPKVDVAQPLVVDVTAYLDATGTTEPVERVDILARVPGFLEEIHFMPPEGWSPEENASAGSAVAGNSGASVTGEPKAGTSTPAANADQQPPEEPDFVVQGPGEFVKKGDRLYTIEQSVYLAAVNQAKAAMAVAMAEAEDARAKYERAKPLAEKGAVAPEELFEKLAAAHVGQAKIKAAQANLEKAELDLEYTTVRSPIDGRIGKTLVDRGNLVGETEATHLTTVINWDDMYANFNISERALLELRAGVREKEIEPQDIEVFIGQEDEKGYPHAGYFDYADLAIETSTGTFMIRARFDNEDRIIIPGAFVRVRIPLDVLKNSLLVPEAAVGSDQRGRFLLVVDGENTVARRGVVLGAKYGEMILIREGLQAGEKIIIEGLQRARPGAAVDPQLKKLTPPQEVLDTAPDADTTAPQDTPAAEPATGPVEPAAEVKETPKSTEKQTTP